MSFWRKCIFDFVIPACFYSAILIAGRDLISFHSSEPFLPGSLLGSDPVLITCILQWNIDSFNDVSGISVLDAPIFYPSKLGKFFSEHLFGELLYAYPLSFFITSPLWIYNLTYTLNLLTVGLAAYYLCLYITASRIASLLAGGLILCSWNFQQLQNTALGWVIFAIYFFIRHIESPKWHLAAGLAISLILASLSNNYLMLFIPIVLIVILVVILVNNRTKLSITWIIQIAIVMFVVGIIVLPVIQCYIKVKEEYGMNREGYKTAAFRFAFSARDRKNEGLSDSRIVQMSAAAYLQLVLAAIGIYITIRRKAYPWNYAFLSLALLAFWMSAFQFSPFLLFSHLPGYDELRAVHRWYLLGAVALVPLSSTGLAVLVTERRIGTIIITAFIGSICFLTFLMTADSEWGRPEKISPVHIALGRLPKGPICILPITESKLGKTSQIESSRMIYQLRHYMPMTGGRSGFIPKLNQIVRNTIRRRGITPYTIKLLNQTGVRYLVVDSLAGPNRHLLNSMRKRNELKILYDRNDELIAELTPSMLELSYDQLVKLWQNSPK